MVWGSYETKTIEEGVGGSREPKSYEREISNTILIPI